MNCTLKRNMTRFSLSILLVLALVSSGTVLFAITQLPGEVTVLEGSQLDWQLSIPGSIAIRTDKDGYLKLNGDDLTKENWLSASARALSFEPVKMGSVEMELRLLGLIPLKKVQVNVLPAKSVIPGGQAVGIILKSEGLTVIDTAPVSGIDGEQWPARDAGIQSGDIILSINGLATRDQEQASRIVDRAGQEGNQVVLKIKRNGHILTVTLKPIYSPEQRQYLLGLWVRESTAGVGTLTFWDPETGLFAALGHMVADHKNEPVSFSEGQLLRASITAINPSRQGYPGEKIGSFLSQDRPLGTIESNTMFGVSGYLIDEPPPSIYQEPLPIAPGHQIKEGPAQMITVLEGQKSELFDIHVEKINLQNQEGKNLVIRITDQRLLERTGGIVQGMSGSPIIQDGYLIGAVTHVFVNDASRGYAILVEQMILNTSYFEEKVAN